MSPGDVGKNYVRIIEFFMPITLQKLNRKLFRALKC